AKLDPTGAEHDIAVARTEMVRARSAKVRPITTHTASAEFQLVFDGSNKPDRVEYRNGDASLRNAEDALLAATYPVIFPEVSSVKIVMRGLLTCGSSGCTLELKAPQTEPPATYAAR